MAVEISQLLPIIKQKGKQLSRPWHGFVIQECGEPLVSLEGMGGLAFESPAPYVALGAPYGDKGPYYLRKTVSEKLAAAQKKLSALKPGWRIRVFDALRPIAVQAYMVAYTFREHAVAKGVDPLKLDEKTRETLLEEVYEFWSPPGEDPNMPPPHSTGGALDCTLQDETGAEISMGSPIDFIGPESSPEFFADKPDGKLYDQNRRLLYTLLTDEGFHRHPGEWWHFSYGDQIWAWQAAERGVKGPVAMYGRLE